MISTVVDCRGKTAEETVLHVLIVVCRLFSVIRSINHYLGCYVAPMVRVASS